MVDQARQASERVADAEWMKASATQEAAYYRAKLAAFESSNEGEVLHLEQERVSDLEQHMSAPHLNSLLSRPLISTASVQKLLTRSKRKVDGQRLP
jgi:hypothetical protein